MKYKFQISKELSDKRLDLAIPLIVDSLSRSQIKKIIESNQLLVNNRVEYRANYKVKVGDLVEFEASEVSQVDKIIPEKMDLEILYEDEDLVVINKPEGVVTHPATGNWTGTIMNGLMYKYKNLGNVGDPIRSGLIHRIDKDTSGILLIGKTNKGLWHYSKLFSLRKVSKSYLAVVRGDMSKLFNGNQSKIEKNYIARNPGDRKKMAVVGKLDEISLPVDARIAETEFKIIDSNKNYSLVLASPKTGRTHQIRVQLQNLGYPIVGDNIYRGEKMERLMLHAYKLQINHMDGHILEIVAPPPISFTRVLEIAQLSLHD